MTLRYFWQNDLVRFPWPKFGQVQEGRESSLWGQMEYRCLSYLRFLQNGTGRKGRFRRMTTWILIKSLYEGKRMGKSFLFSKGGSSLTKGEWFGVFWGPFVYKTNHFYMILLRRRWWISLSLFHLSGLHRGLEKSTNVTSPHSISLCKIKKEEFLWT